MRVKFDAEAHIVSLNTLRVQLSKKPFTSDTIREGIRSCKLPINDLFWDEFRNSGLLKQIDKNLYCFNDPFKPIHFNKLNDIYRRYRDRANKYQSTWYDKKKAESTLKDMQIKKAITLLRDNGFEVVRKVYLNLLFHSYKDSICMIIDINQFLLF